jgi:hypothetical protein
MQLPDKDQPIDFKDKNIRCEAAQLISNLFDRWALDNNTRLNLLGLSPSSRTLFKGYREGTSPLPASRDTLDRAGWLLAIHKALRLLYPRNPELRYSWVSRRNEAFDNRTPIEVMTEGGLIGIARVSRYLDYYRGQ